MTRMIISYILPVFIFSFVQYVTSFPEGAPEKACFVMVPRHTNTITGRPVKAQRSSPPFNITLSRRTFNPDIPVTVTIQGARGLPFRGFLLVAAEDGTKDLPTGIFHSYNRKVKTMFCNYRNDAATHAGGGWKTSVSVDWYAPPSTAADFIQFVATIVMNRTTYWTDIRSAMLQADPNMQEAPEIEGMAEGGWMVGGGGGPGMDAWGYPTTPSYSFNSRRFGWQGNNEMGRGGNGRWETTTMSNIGQGQNGGFRGGQNGGFRGGPNFGRGGFWGGGFFGRNSGNTGEVPGQRATTPSSVRGNGKTPAGKESMQGGNKQTNTQGSSQTGGSARNAKTRSSNRQGSGGSGNNEQTSSSINWFMNWARNRGMFDPRMFPWTG